MAKKQSELITLGWSFWAITFAVLLVPAIYGSWKIVRSDETILVPIAIGALASAVAAAIIAVIANSLIQLAQLARPQPAPKKKRKK